MDQQVIYSPELRQELLDWLAPVGLASDAYIDRMQQYANELGGTNPKINVYNCKNGHQTVTQDRDKCSAQKIIPCPYCRQEARSSFYMCDQQLMPTHEFYTPIDPLAHPKKDRAAFRRGAMAFKLIYSPEPIRHTKKLKPTAK